MNRASFLKSILTIGLGSALPTKLFSYQKVYLLQCFIAGFQYYDGNKLLSLLQSGDLLELRREPENEADERAIAVFRNGNKLGFIPRRDNKTLSRLIDAEAIPLIAEITHINASAAAWEQVYIAVSILKKQYGPFAPHARYLTTINDPEYRSKPRYNDKKDWYRIIEQESRTDHFYDLWYSNGPYPDMPDPTHNGDFILVRRSSIPSKLRPNLENDVTVCDVHIDSNSDINDYALLKTGNLGNYLEAAKSMQEVFDCNGDNYLELHFT